MSSKAQWRKELEPFKRQVIELLDAHASSAHKIERVATEVRTVARTPDRAAVRQALVTLGYLQP